MNQVNKIMALSDEVTAAAAREGYMPGGFEAARAALRSSIIEALCIDEPSAHVAWCRYVTEHDQPTRIVLCDSDAEGAFPVFRRQSEDELLREALAALTYYREQTRPIADCDAVIDRLRARLTSNASYAAS